MPRCLATTSATPPNVLRDSVWYPTLAKAECPGRRRGALVGGRDARTRDPEMLFSVYARFIPNRTRRDGSALVSRMDGPPSAKRAE